MMTSASWEITRSSVFRVRGLTQIHAASNQRHPADPRTDGLLHHHESLHESNTFIVHMNIKVDHHNEFPVDVCSMSSTKCMINEDFNVVLRLGGYSAHDNKTVLLHE